MPFITEWVDPEIFVETIDVRIYHTYKNDEIEVGPSTYWYTTDTFGTASDGHEEGCEFDVRTLPAWNDADEPAYGTVRDIYGDRLSYMRSVILDALGKNLIPIATTNRMSRSN